MKPYPKYKPSGIEWIGEIPAHWNFKKMKYSSAKKKFSIVDGPFGTQLKADEYISEGIPLLRITNLSYAGKLLIDDLVFISEEKAKEIERSKITIGDIIIGKTGATIGKSAFNNRYEYAIIASSCLKISPDSEQLYPIFLKYFICSYNFQTELVENSGGSTRDTINIEPFKRLFCVIPPKEEQASIANYLDKKTEQIDDFIAKKQKLIELLKEERTAIINEAVSGGLNHDSPDLYDKHDSKTKKSGNQTNHKNHSSDNWERKKLKYIIRINSGDGIKSEEIDFEGTFPVYGGNGIMGYTEKFNSDKEDIIIGRVGAKCGNVRLVNGQKWISDNALVASVINGYNLNYVAMLLEALNLNSLANQNAQPLITGTLVKEKIAVFPPIKEQSIIFQNIQTETKRIDNTISKIEKEIELMQEYRTALISEVVTGKVKVV